MVRTRLEKKDTMVKAIIEILSMEKRPLGKPRLRWENHVKRIDKKVDIIRKRKTIIINRIIKFV